MHSGDIYRHDRFYRELATGELKRKYFIFLAPVTGGDWVVRLLTSRSNMRTENPPCSYANPYPGFFLGVVGDPLTRKSWVDLRAMEDVDAVEGTRLVQAGIMALVKILPPSKLRPLLECAAAASDTTTRQERAMRDELARLVQS